MARATRSLRLTAQIPAVSLPRPKSPRISQALRALARGSPPRFGTPLRAYRVQSPLSEGGRDRIEERVSRKVMTSTDHATSATSREESFAALFDASMQHADSLREGEIVQGHIIKFNRDSVIVDNGYN